MPDSPKSISGRSGHRQSLDVTFVALYDASVHELEKDKIFSRTWQIVGHASQVANPGDFFTTELIGEPLLLVRGADGALRGFYNVCRHRAGPPAEGCGSRKALPLRLPRLDLRSRRFTDQRYRDRRRRRIRAKDFALAPVHTEEWFNFVFVNLDPQATPLIKSLGELQKQAEKFPFAGVKLFERRTYKMKCNWKTYVDNYLEGYHLPSVHPGLNRELDFNAYVVEPYAHHVRQFSPIRGAQPGDTTPRRYQEAHEDLTTDYFWIFPNWMLTAIPTMFR